MDSNRTSNGGCLGLGLDLNTELRTLTLFQLKIRKGSIFRGANRFDRTIGQVISTVDPATPDGFVTMFYPSAKRLVSSSAVNDVMICRIRNHKIASIHTKRGGHDDVLLSLIYCR